MIRVTCPTTPMDSDIVGCGRTFDATPDDEGMVDCPNCGMWFRPKPSYEDLLAALKAFHEAETRYANAVNGVPSPEKQAERTAAAVEISTAMGIAQHLIQAAEA